MAEPRVVLRIIALLLAVSMASHAASRPNIIVILADDMGYSDLGCFGGEIDTPNLDRLAAEGLRFTHFYNTGRCCPTRASLLTGHYQHRAGVGHMDSDKGLPGYRGHIVETSATLAEVLGAAGYQTFMSGKWHVGKAKQHRAPARGFDRVFHSPHGGGIYFAPFQYDRPLFLDGDLVEPGGDFYSTDAFTDYALQFIDEALAGPERKPFFLYLPYIAPHFPLQAHAEDIRKYLDRGTYAGGWERVRRARFEKQREIGLAPESWSLSAPHNHVAEWSKLSDAERDHQENVMATYAAMIDRLDQNIGRLLKKLEEKGIAEDTLVLFCSDNGAEGAASPMSKATLGKPIGGAGSKAKLGLSWANASNTPFRRFKADTQQGGIVSPMVLRWPAGIERAGGGIERTAGHVIDLMATFVELAAAPYPKEPIHPTDGISLVPLFSKGGEVERGAPLFFEHQGERAVIDGPWKLQSMQKGKWRLYDLASDPQEEKDLAAMHPDRFAALAKKWKAWADETGVVEYPPKKRKR